MAAYLDKTQSIGFFYGNASKDLADRLPPDSIPSMVSELSPQSLSLKVDSIFESLEILERKNEELSFFVSDLVKLLK
jgi:hypothetical protein